MTLLGILDCGDRVLLAGDTRMLSQDSGIHIAETVDKIWHFTPNVVWGYTGDSGVGDEFKGWLEAQSFQSWYALGEAAKVHLATLNGRAQKLGHLAEAPRQHTACLIAGWISGEKHVGVITADGGFPAIPRTPAFLGSGMPFAAVSWEVVKELTPDGDVEAAFRVIMETTAAHVPMLGPVAYLEAHP